MAESSQNGRIAIRIAGSGGQGVVLAGVILAEAAVLAGRNAAQSQVYGPESRGGAARSDVVIADGEIGFPTAQVLDVLVALTQSASDRYSSDLKPAGLLVVDEQEVPDPPAGSWAARPLPIIATSVRVAGSPVAANVVALGVLVGVTGVVDAWALERAVVACVPPGSRELNLRALAAGVSLAGTGAS